ncbi:MAG: hypothetical protein L3J32_11360 [Rhizobiaceae bacterium]|nr:hypothetical protein [Rhizobiaceae bacterium]
MKTSLVISGLLISSILIASSAYAQQVCTCRYKGVDVPEGKNACIKTANGYKVATCAKVLNNTSWQISKKACPVG